MNAMKTCTLFLLFTMLSATFTMACDKNKDAMTNEANEMKLSPLPAPVPVPVPVVGANPAGGVRDPSVHPIVNGGVRDPSIRPIAPPIQPIQPVQPVTPVAPNHP